MNILPFRLALNRFLMLSGIWLLISAAAIAQPTVDECQEAYEIPVCVDGNAFVVSQPNGDNEVTFTIKQLKATDPPENTESCPNETNWFQLFWDFGDGQYDCGFGENGTPLTITHKYAEAGNFNPRLIVTKRYTDDDPPESESESSGLLKDVWEPIELDPVSIDQASGTPHSGGLGGACIRVTPIHRAHFGEDIWVLVSFMYDGNEEEIEFHFDPGLFEFKAEDFRFYPPGGLSEDPLGNTDGVLTWQTNELEPGLHHIAIPLHTQNQEEVTIQEEEVSYDFFAKIDPGPTQGKDSTCTDLTDTTSETSVGPKDPNAKTVDITLTNSPQPETLTYRISFYNKGKGAASLVTVKDVISPMLDLCEVNMDSVIIDGIPYSASHHSSFSPDIDYDTRTLTWTLNVLDHSSGLMGLWQAGYGFNLADCEDINCDPRTRMELVFSIQTSCTFDYGTIIENEAEIQFDNLELFTTSPARTAKVCCDSLLNTTIMAGALVPILSLYDGTLSPINTSSITATFDSGIPIFDPTAGLFQYPPGFDSLDRVVFRVCDSLGHCETVEEILCVYDPTNPVNSTTIGCSNSSCEDTPCPDPPPTPEPCTFLFWQFTRCWLVYLLYAVVVASGLFGLFLILRKRKKSD